ncbi:hypothetical protein CKL83_20605 [Bacillus anthracis]|uniref:Uncharacterized protein n=1 Tax=Bacillus thuringiensis subsp. konkukian (strain 97-27) TaxID=281309 RepID=Q6HAW5_BACHK|nr:hypothetical protein BT9727_5002 [[Bacillus thuringiensis] serovar konkukian str. 97-27]AQM49266.1 hypothetical protein BZG08_28400 [Bacillus anthracis]ASE30217.1 hypothetical protein CEQ19_14880 [Bacillus anthracis]AWU56124.1 hypothetical protein DNQ11_28240 [Bacillus anthracis]OON50367.1 hypothetical protein B0R37_04865 [Bacillus anthracis]
MNIRKAHFSYIFSKKNAPYPHICETLFPSAQSILPYIKNRLQKQNKESISYETDSLHVIIISL